MLGLGASLRLLDAAIKGDAAAHAGYESAGAMAAACAALATAKRTAGKGLAEVVCCLARDGVPAAVLVDFVGDSLELARLVQRKEGYYASVSTDASWNGATVAHALCAGRDRLLADHSTTVNALQLPPGASVCLAQFGHSHTQFEAAFTKAMRRAAHRLRERGLELRVRMAELRQTDTRAGRQLQRVHRRAVVGQEAIAPGAERVRDRGPVPARVRADARIIAFLSLDEARELERVADEVDEDGGGHAVARQAADDLREALARGSLRGRERGAGRGHGAGALVARVRGRVALDRRVEEPERRAEAEHGHLRGTRRFTPSR